VRYPIHAALGTTINAVRGPAPWAATQWVKAAAHVRSQADLRAAGAGIAAARQRGGAPVEAALCSVAAGGAPAVQVAIALGGAECAARFFVRIPVPDGTPVEYGSRPPIGGPRYASGYPRYGVTIEQVPPGRWLANIAQGAVVLLYNCPTPCPDLVADLQAVYTRLPPDPDRPDREARMLITAYPQMERRLAVVAWGYLLEMDRVDPDAIVQFYTAHVGRGPEGADGGPPG
jgi:hypothetical protein